MWKSRFLFLITFIMATIFAVTYKDTNIGLTIIYAQLIMFLYSFISIITAIFCVSIEQVVSTDCISKKEKLLYTIRVRNKGIFLYANMKKQYYSDDMFNYITQCKGRNSLHSREVMVNEYELEFPYRGIYEIGLKRVTLVDFFGLLSVSFKLNDPTYITVFPNLDEEITISENSQTIAVNPNYFNEDYSSVADIRKYRSSDHLKKIHWKLSAKRGDLMVKNYDFLERDKTLIFLDTTKIPLEKNDKLKFEDSMISYVASAINICVKSKVCASFVYGNTKEKQVEIDYSDGISKAFRILSSVDFDNSIFKFNYSATISKPHNYILFLSNINEDIYKSILSIRTSDNGITLFYFYSQLMPIDEHRDLILSNLATQNIIVNKIEIEQGNKTIETKSTPVDNVKA